MIINTQLSDSLYLQIRREIKIYYFGQGGFADYNGDTIAQFNEKEMLLLFLANGARTIGEIIEIMASQEMNEEYDIYEVKNLIDKMLKRGIVVSRKKKESLENTIYGEKGKFYPKDITIELTNICNFGCSFCYKNAKAKGKFISDEKINAIDEIIRGKVHSILLTGGEPTIHPHFLKYVELFSQYADVRIISNGSRLYEFQSSVLDKIKLIQFSMYGCSDNEYAKTTGMGDGFTRLRKSVDLIIDKKIPFLLASTINVENIDNLEEYVQAAIELKATTIKLGIVEPYGRGLNNYDRDYYKERMKYFLDELLRLKRLYKKDIHVFAHNINTDHISKEFFNNNIEGRLDCGCGTETVVVSQDGILRACEFLPEKYFDLGGIEILKKQINGEFARQQFCDKVVKYFEQGNIELKMEACNSLKNYYYKELSHLKMI